MTTPFSDLDTLAIQTIRTLSIDAIDKANSGHPGLPLGAAPMAYVLWSRFLKHHPKNPHWPDRDRFVLSAGHGSMLLYSLLHLFGYNLSLEEIKNFRQWKSLTPGHPEFGLTPGVEATTGPLGQGSANAVGMAIAERFLAQHFNRPGFSIVDHMTYALVSDGDLMEGISAEAASLAGHLKLGKLVYLYDSNNVTLDGPTSMTFSSENVEKRYESYGWQVLKVENGDTDLSGLFDALEKAKKEITKPSLIIVTTTIGYGSPNRAGTSEAHGKPLGNEENRLTKEKLGWKSKEPFFIPEEAKKRFAEFTEAGAKAEKEWNRLFEDYAKKHGDLAKQWALAQDRLLPAGWADSLTRWKKGEKLATRVASGKILNELSQHIGYLFGGDADLSCSTNTLLKDQGSFNGQEGKGKNIHYGVREHAMAAIANGIAYHEGSRTFTATFFCFSDYMKPSIRLAAMNHLPITYVFTHDSIGLGEDGPTHQPIEHLAALRAIPNLLTIRPCDAEETREAWKTAMENKKGPTALVLTRQNLPVVSEDASQLKKGAYILSEAEKELHVILIGTGSEVSLCLDAKKQLEAKGFGTRVVSMPSWELFEAQPEEYRRQVLPPEVMLKISVEAGSTFGWAKWTGDRGKAIGIDRFGASAPAEILFKEFGLTPDHITQTVESLLDH